MKRGFASDNNAGIHPDIFRAMEAVNHGHAVGYGGDEITAKAISLFREEFGPDTEVYFVFNGTGANVLGLSTVTQSFNSIICTETAHIQEDECGAPEKFTGCKLLTVPPSSGKLTVESIKQHLKGFEFEHHSQPRVISISQCTEMGTVYTVDEIKQLADLTHSYGMLLHMDGARLANAAVSLNLPFRAFTVDAGVDILSFGGTKNGLMMGEAVLFFNSLNTQHTKYLRKQCMQLFSKMRFVSAQFMAYFSNQLWLKNAAHANRMASLLAEKVSLIPGVTITQPVQANGVFAIIPHQVIAPLQAEYFFYVWDEKHSEVRWMTSFDTTEDDVEQFAVLLKKLMQNHAAV